MQGVDDDVGLEEPGQRARDIDISETNGRAGNGAHDGDNGNIEQGNGRGNNDGRRREAPDQRQENRNQRLRPDPFSQLQPTDIQNTIPRRYQPITIVELSSASPKRFRTAIYLQIVRIVSGSNIDPSGAKATSFTYYNKKHQQEKNGTYKRLILCMVFGTHQLVYLVENTGTNENLWSKSPQHRDSGVITIGTIFALLNPLPIKSELSNIRMIETEGGVVIMRSPTSYKSVPIISNIAQNVTRGFVLNNKEIDILACSALKTRCSGLFCDKQRSYELKNSQKGCGCYSMISCLSSIVMKLSFGFDLNNSSDEIIEIEHFCSLQFMRLFLSDALPHSTQRNMLDGNEVLDDVFDALDNIFNYININGGFTIIGWYKLGNKSDASNNDSINHELTGKMNYHVTNLYPTNKSITKRAEFNRMNFDVATLF